METVNIEELVQDQHNFNKGTEEGARLMEKSFTELGAGRSILIDKDGHIIAGNKSQKAAMAAGIKKVRVIESDGTELIAVKRTDISIDSKEGRELALADNLTTQVNLAWDNVELASVAAEQGIDLPDWGLDPAELELTDEAEIERKRKEFADRMANGENLDEDEEYQAFKEKFEQKKTTDDCYTPELVYEAVADWVANEYGLNRKDFVRPFYPGGDYQKEKYPKGCIVVDNPPFSIMAEILNFYNDNGIRFFLFAPHLTLMNSRVAQKFTALAVGVSVTYENGATIATSFLTNLDDKSIAMKSAPSLYAQVKKANDEIVKEQKKQLHSYIFDKHLITTPIVASFSKYGIDFAIPANESQVVWSMDKQKEQTGKNLFGGAFLVSDRVVSNREAKEAEKVERIRELGISAEGVNAFDVPLSDREKAIIQELNKKAEQ